MAAKKWKFLYRLQAAWSVLFSKSYYVISRRNTECNAHWNMTREDIAKTTYYIVTNLDGCESALNEAKAILKDDATH